MDAFNAKSTYSLKCYMHLMVQSHFIVKEFPKIMKKVMAGA